MNHFDSITTDRLTLRELRLTDFDAVHAYASDPEVSRYMNWGPNTEDETRTFIQRALAQQQCRDRAIYQLAICLRAGELIGGCGLYVTDQQARQGFIGYVLHRAHWGNGYATECARALLSHGFGALGLHRIWTDCDTENRASAHVLEKVGMRREGELVDCKLIDGVWRNSYVYAILAHESESTKAIFP